MNVMWEGQVAFCGDYKGWENILPQLVSDTGANSAVRVGTELTLLRAESE
jgi:hypothetical protein